jgi:hypothetical protein
MFKGGGVSFCLKEEVILGLLYGKEDADGIIVSHVCLVGL